MHLPAFLSPPPAPTNSRVISETPPGRRLARRGRLWGALVVAAFLVEARFAAAQAPAESEKPAEMLGVKVGTGVAEFEADDSMVIAGGIGPGKATGQEGKLRAVAIVLAKSPGEKLAIVACDILMIRRQYLDPVMAEIERTTGISITNILVNCTHTHHAPSAVKLLGVEPDEVFTRRVQQGIIQAVQAANSHLSATDCRFYFRLGKEKTVGQNSRLMMGDGQIYWIGPRDNAVRATALIDSELPVLAFRGENDRLQALIFNHSTHNIGTRLPGRRSPSIYGLAAQDLETELGGTVCFLEGASGSTHNLELTCDEASRRIEQAVQTALAQTQPRNVDKLAALKQPFKFKVRQFDESREENAVARYCRKYVPEQADKITAVFRSMRQELNAESGEERTTWLQVMRIGDVAFVGVPGELFTPLGLDIKNRSPFRFTYVAELANDWIGYIPDRESQKLGGYQCWTGQHSYVEPGTGERIVDQVTRMLRELKK